MPQPSFATTQVNQTCQTKLQHLLPQPESTTTFQFSTNERQHSAAKPPLQAILARKLSLECPPTQSPEASTYLNMDTTRPRTTPPRPHHSDQPSQRLSNPTNHVMQVSNITQLQY